MKVEEKSYNLFLRGLKLLVICVGIIITFLNIIRKFNQGILKENILNMGANILVGIIISIFILGIGKNLDKVWNAFKQSKEGICYAVYFSVFSTLLFNPLDATQNAINSFKRVIGEGVVAGVDVTKRVDNFHYWFFCLFFYFVIFWLGANYCKQVFNIDKNKKIIKLLDDIVIIANATLLFRCVGFFFASDSNWRVFNYATYFLTLILTIGIAYLFFKKKNNLDILIRFMIAGWMFSYPLTILLADNWSDGISLLGVQTFISIIILSACYLYNKSYINISWNSVNYISYALLLVASVIPFGISFYIELISILNQHQIFIGNVQLGYIFLSIAECGAVVVLTILLRKKAIYDLNWKKYVYPNIIFGMVCLYCQIPVSGVYNADIFETANASILISDFLKFGKIPIVEHYGGHMMSGVWEGLLYSWLNKDSNGAIFAPYGSYLAVVVCVLFYLVIKDIWNEDAAILLVLFFPFYDLISYWGLGLLVCLGATLYVRKQTFLSAYIFWGTVVWCTLYRLDIGYAFGMAAILAFIVYIIMYKSIKVMKQLIISLIVWGIMGGGLWFGLCAVKNINPITRLIEFLKINFSNQNWGYSIIGNTDNRLVGILMGIAYVVIPFTVVIFLVIYVLNSKIREKKNWICIIILGFSFVFNFSRGLVRHSLVEGTLQFLWTACLFLPVVFAIMFNNKRIFFFIFTIFTIGYTFCFNGINGNIQAVSDIAIAKIPTYTNDWKYGDYWKDIKRNKEVIQRVNYDESLKSDIEDYKFLLNEILEEGETYIDFINKTFVYSAINKEDPVYVSQSPLQLSGEFTQEQFIKEIKNIPLVLMPIDGENSRASEMLDGISNSYRYYKISEYIYQHYVPVCKYESKYAVWCLPEKYNLILNKIKKLEEMNKKQDILKNIEGSIDVIRYSSDIILNSNGTFNIKYTDVDPGVYEIQNAFDYEKYVGQNITLQIGYNTDTAGELVLYYTTDEGEEYSENKVCRQTIQKQGIAYFKIPITNYTRIRLDTPEESNVNIYSFDIGTHFCSEIGYGYDGPYKDEKNENYTYLPGIHNYALNELPLIWAEMDEKESCNNNVIENFLELNGVFTFDTLSENKKNKGNYIKVEINSSEDNASANLKIGKYDNEKFDTKYIYSFSLKKGLHQYMFRVSSDYYWYTDQINAVALESNVLIDHGKMQILQGD